MDLVKNITCPDWRVRISVCQAFPSFLQYTGDKIFTVNINSHLYYILQYKMYNQHFNN